MTPGRICLLLTSPRVAPGLLAWPAWQLLRRADRVLTDEPDHPQRGPLETAGITLEQVDAALDPLAVARLLADEASADGEVVWLAGDDGAPDVGRALGHLLATRAESGATGLPELEVVAASYDLPGARLLDLVSVMDQLRARCPWVQQQTHRSLVRYLVEEAYETVEAIESGDRTHLREELGDLLFQVVFHARLAEEAPESTGQPEPVEGYASLAGDQRDEGDEDDEDDDKPSAATWTIDDVAGDLVEKLIHRNPHVFGSATTGDVAEIENVWDSLKAEEKRRTSAVEGVPLALPALTLAEKLLGRTARSDLGLPPPELAVDALPAHPDADQLGAALFALVARARAAGLDPEQALRDACRRYVNTVRAAEASGPPAE